MHARAKSSPGETKNVPGGASGSKKAGEYSGESGSGSSGDSESDGVAVSDTVDPYASLNSTSALKLPKTAAERLRADVERVEAMKKNAKSDLSLNEGVIDLADSDPTAALDAIHVNDKVYLELIEGATLEERHIL